MGLVIIAGNGSSSTPHLSPLSDRLRRRVRLQSRPLCRHVPTSRRLSSFETITTSRFGNLVTHCSVTNIDVDLDVVTSEDEASEEIPSLPSGCSVPVVSITSDILNSNPLDLSTEETTFADSLLKTWPVLSEEEQEVLAATPAHPAGLYALYASSIAGNLVEQLWNFALPAAVAMLHPSLLPVAVVGFFTKLTIFIGGPLVGDLMDSFPRIPSYYTLNTVQTTAQLLSAAMIIHALKSLHHTSKSAVIFKPWFVILVLAGAVERLAGLALGVTMERDWVVLLAGPNRPIALAQANAMLNRIDLLCEIAGASLFGILLSKYDPVTCLKLVYGMMIATLPVLIILGHAINRLSSGVLDRSRFCQNFDKSFGASLSTGMKNIVQNGLKTIRNGWKEYKNQPVLPASLAYVLLYFNIALAHGSIMTTFLTHHGINPAIIGAFSGLCAFMGVAATFLSSSLVRRLGILKAGAAGLLFQASLLATAAIVFWTSSISKQTSLLLFLSLIVLSRLGHMSYDVVGTQILQTGIPINKANLIGATEVSIASLAEFLMLGVAIIANDVSHFGFLVMLSVSSVAVAAGMFCRWLANPTDEQKKLFSFDPHFSVDAAEDAFDDG